MAARFAGARLAVVLMCSAMLVSCGPMGAAPTSQAGQVPTLVPTAGPTVTTSPAPSPTPLPPSPQPTSTAIPPTAVPPATPAPGPVTIEIVGESPRHTFIEPGDTARLPYWAEYVALVHYPYPLGSAAGGSSQPYRIQVSVSSPDWQAGLGNFPDAQTLDLHLMGTTAGRFTVSIDAGPDAQPVSFTLEIAPPVPTVAPSATAAPSATPGTAQSLTVTLADDGKTIELHPGDRFLLNLGDSYDWSVTVADPAVVSRVVNVLVVRGAQGIYEAGKPGATTLTATGDPPCRKAQPACGAPSRLFRVQITVL